MTDRAKGRIAGCLGFAACLASSALVAGGVAWAVAGGVGGGAGEAIRHGSMDRRPAAGQGQGPAWRPMPDEAFRPGVDPMLLWRLEEDWPEPALVPVPGAISSAVGPGGDEGGGLP